MIIDKENKDKLNPVKLKYTKDYLNDWFHKFIFIKKIKPNTVYSFIKDSPFRDIHLEYPELINDFKKDVNFLPIIRLVATGLSYKCINLKLF